MVSVPPTQMCEVFQKGDKSMWSHNSHTHDVWLKENRILNVLVMYLPTYVHVRDNDVDT